MYMIDISISGIVAKVVVLYRNALTVHTVIIILIYAQTQYKSLFFGTVCVIFHKLRNIDSGSLKETNILEFVKRTRQGGGAFHIAESKQKKKIGMDGILR